MLAPYRKALHVQGELKAMNTRSGLDNPVLSDAIGLLQIKLEVLEVRCDMLLKEYGMHLSNSIREHGKMQLKQGLNGSVMLKLQLKINPDS